jgi:hypothetical protein
MRNCCLERSIENCGGKEEDPDGPFAYPRLFHFEQKMRRQPYFLGLNLVEMVWIGRRVAVGNTHKLVWYIALSKS